MKDIFIIVLSMILSLWSVMPVYADDCAGFIKTLEDYDARIEEAGKELAVLDAKIAQKNKEIQEYTDKMKLSNRDQENIQKDLNRAIEACEKEKNDLQQQLVEYIERRDNLEKECKSRETEIQQWAEDNGLFWPIWGKGFEMVTKETLTEVGRKGVGITAVIFDAIHIYLTYEEREYFRDICREADEAWEELKKAHKMIDETLDALKPANEKLEKLKAEKEEYLKAGQRTSKVFEDQFKAMQSELNQLLQARGRIASTISSLVKQRTVIQQSYDECRKGKGGLRCSKCGNLIEQCTCQK